MQKAVFGFLSIALCSCTTHSIKPGFVAQEWTCRLRELQMIPAFPSREELQVGDVYIRRVTNDSSAETASRECGDSSAGFKQLSVWLSKVPLGTELSTHYDSRFSFPKTPPDTVTFDTASGKITVAQVPASTSTDALFAQKGPDRLRPRLVAFPDFMALRVHGAELGAIAPIHAALANIGAGYEVVESASLSIPVAESYGLPADSAYAATSKWLFSNPCKNTAGLSGTERIAGFDYASLLAIAPQVSAGTGAPSSSRERLVLSIIREVYMTRAIDSSVNFKRAFVANLDRNRASSNDQAASAPAVSASASVPAGGGSSAGAGNSIDITALATAVAGQLGNRQGVPGVTFNVRSATQGSVSLTRVFEQPIPIGYRSLDLEVSADEKGCMTAGLRPLDFTVRAPTDATSSGQTGPKPKR